MSIRSVRRLYKLLVDHLGKVEFANRYKNEAAFERDVWKHVAAFMEGAGGEPTATCLTSHTYHDGRDPKFWSQFLREQPGPDVDVLHSKNRLDIVVKPSGGGSIGIEVKCLGKGGHAAKLTQGLGQAMLALENRDFTILLMHCGAVKSDKRNQLRGIAENICRDTRVSVVVVP